MGGKTLKCLLEIPIYVEDRCFTSVKVVKSEIQHIEKGDWSNRDQDWEAVVVMKSGDRFKISLPIFRKLVAVQISYGK